MGAPQLLQEHRENVQAHGHPAGEAECPAQLARPVGDRANGLAHVLKHALSKLDETLGRGGHTHLPSHAQEQRLAELLFEQQNLPADRGLRHVQLPPARGERSGFSDGLKDFELAEIHVTAIL